jgi:hypothetical protein
MYLVSYTLKKKKLGSYLLISVQVDFAAFVQQCDLKSFIKLAFVWKEICVDYKAFYYAYQEKNGKAVVAIKILIIQ